MRVAGMLLTGGRSSRLGTDKAALACRPPWSSPPETFAGRTARLLSAVAEPVVEVGPGFSGLPTVADETPGAGPLAAIVSGMKGIGAMEGNDGVLVVATDMPYLTGSLLAWLARHPSTRSVVPVADGRPQTLCARYQWRDLLEARTIVGRGGSAMRDLVEHIGPLLVGAEVWGPVAADGRALLDVDTPADLTDLQSRW